MIRENVESVLSAALDISPNENVNASMGHS